MKHIKKKSQFIVDVPSWLWKNISLSIFTSTETYSMETHVFNLGLPALLKCLHGNTPALLL